MSVLSRRDFLAHASSMALAAGTAGAIGSASAAIGPDDTFDLLIKGGEVLDPSQSLRGKRDIGIRYGVVQALEADIPAARAQRVLDASGKLVTPGLVDLHTHVYPYGSAIGIPADELVAHQCTTTCVSAVRGRTGDILTHAYSGAPNMSGAFTNIVQNGKLLSAALAAKQRGVIFDVGHGGGSFDYTVAEIAIPQGCGPDTISSDIHVFSGNTPGMPYLTWVMSKFMGLGFSLEDVVAMATIKPAAVINRTPKLGSLQVGAPGDVAIMDVVEGPGSFVDTRNNKREGKGHLKPVQPVAASLPFGRPSND